MPNELWWRLRGYCNTGYGSTVDNTSTVKDVIDGGGGGDRKLSFIKVVTAFVA